MLTGALLSSDQTASATEPATRNVQAAATPATWYVEAGARLAIGKLGCGYQHRSTGDAGVQLWELGGENNWTDDLRRNRIEDGTRYGLLLPGGVPHARFPDVSEEGASFDVSLRNNVFSRNKVSAVGVTWGHQADTIGGRTPEPLKDLLLYAADNVFKQNGTGAPAPSPWAGGAPAAFSIDEDIAQNAVLDFGGGALGSPGGNRFVNNETSFALANYTASTMWNFFVPRN